MSNDGIASSTEFGFLRSAFSLEQELLLASLRSSSRIHHSGDKGEVNEQYFIDFLRSYLPNRYTVEKAMVIDSKGAVSHSIDVVVFDRQYTPTLLDVGKHRYVPAEAVYAVFECKPTINAEHLRYTADKIESVRNLHRTSIPIQHAGGQHSPKKPFPIVGGILAIEVSWTTGLGETFRESHRSLTGNKLIDCGFAANGASFDVFADSGEYEFGPDGNALGFFAFRLLSKLQSFGTVTAVDWAAYAENLKNGSTEN